MDGFGGGGMSGIIGEIQNITGGGGSGGGGGSTVEFELPAEITDQSKVST